MKYFFVTFFYVSILLNTRSCDQLDIENSRSKCYDCKLSLDPKCENPDDSIIRIPCMMADREQCLKVVVESYTNTYKKEIVRTCATPFLACGKMAETFKARGYETMSHCSLCQGDLCNGTATTEMNLWRLLCIIVFCNFIMGVFTKSTL